MLILTPSMARVFPLDLHLEDTTGYKILWGLFVFVAILHAAGAGTSGCPDIASANASQGIGSSQAIVAVFATVRPTFCTLG